MLPFDLPDFRPGIITREVADALNNLRDAVKRLANLNAGFGLTITDDWSGPRLSLSSQLDNLDSVAVQNLTIPSGGTLTVPSISLPGNPTVTVPSGGSLTINGPGVQIFNLATELCGPMIWCEFTEATWSTAGVNNYSPSTWKTILRVSTSVGLTTVTGLVPVTPTVGNPDELIVVFQNVGSGSNDVAFTNEDANSTAGNRFRIPGGATLTLKVDQSALFAYDYTTRRWRMLWTDGIPGGGTLPAAGNDFNNFRQVGTSPYEFWYDPTSLFDQGPTTFNVGTNQIYTVPFLTPRGGTLDRIGVNVGMAGGAGKHYRLGIYATAGPTSLYPTTLVLDTGDQDANATGMNAITCNVVLTAGALYWLAIFTEATTLGVSGVVSGGVGGGGVPNLLGRDNTLGANPSHAWQLGQAYGALPNPFTAGASTWLGRGDDVPIIGVRYSA